MSFQNSRVGGLPFPAPLRECYCIGSFLPAPFVDQFFCWGGAVEVVLHDLRGMGLGWWREMRRMRWRLYMWAFAG